MPGEGHRVFLCRIDDGQQGNLTAVLDGLCTSGPVIADAISLFPGLTDIALVYCHSKQVILCVKKFLDELCIIDSPVDAFLEGTSVCVLVVFTVLCHLRKILFFSGPAKES